jgi:hypothetical protein
MAAPIIGVLALGLHFAAPLLSGLPSLTACAAPRAEIITSQDLDLYRQAKALGNKDVASAARTHIVERTAQIRRSSAALLPPVWSARTRWQIDMAVAQAQRGLLSCL